MGFHEFNTDFTLDPRVAMTDHKNVSRGLGNQVTVEFNLLYRFHCAISKRDEEFTEKFMKEMHIDYLDNQDAATNKSHVEWDHARRVKEAEKLENKNWNPKSLSLNEFMALMGGSRKPTKEPSQREFGLKDDEEYHFARNPITGLFDDQKMLSQLLKSMDDPICRSKLCNSNSGSQSDVLLQPTLVLAIYHMSFGTLSSWALHKHVNGMLIAIQWCSSSSS